MSVVITTQKHNQKEQIKTKCETSNWIKAAKTNSKEMCRFDMKMILVLNSDTLKFNHQNLYANCKEMMFISFSVSLSGLC